MIFVMLDSSKTQQERLTKLLLASFPGSVIYQHLNAQHASHDVLCNKVDAVFLEAGMEKANGLPLIQILRRQKPELPVFIIAKTNGFHENADDVGVNGYFVLPDQEQQLLEAIRLIKNKEKVS